MICSYHLVFETEKSKVFLSYEERLAFLCEIEEIKKIIHVNGEMSKPLFIRASAVCGSMPVLSFIDLGRYIASLVR